LSEIVPAAAHPHQARKRRAREFDVAFRNVEHESTGMFRAGGEIHDPR
jgi:hypothetical protein